MNKIIKSVSLALALTLSMTMLYTQKVHADTGITAAPPAIRTKDEVTKVTVDTGGRESYVLYTTTLNNPSVDDMWHIPESYPNVQDFNIPGIWYLHVYVPSLDDWEIFGPYEREAVAPIVPVLQFTQGGENKWVNTDVSYTVNCRGDNGESGYDNINHLPSYFESGFSHNVSWNETSNTEVPLAEGELANNILVTTEGWHTGWAKSVDKVGNESDWASVQFGIDRTAPTLDNATATRSSDGITVNAIGMRDNGLSGNKQLIFSIGSASKTVDVATEGDNKSVTFSPDEISGYSSSSDYTINIKRVDQVGNNDTTTFTLTGSGSSSGGGSGDDSSSDDSDNTSYDSGSGDIKFNPDHTSWTNSGKQSEGQGNYPVNVYFSGDNPYTRTGTAHVKTKHVSHHTHTDPDGSTHTSTTTTYSYSTKTFPVYFYLNSIIVSGAASGTISGTSGNIGVRTEGEALKLYAYGVWGDAQWTRPSVGSDSSITSVDIPEKPTQPTGNSGKYNLDWTKSTIYVTDPEREWYNDSPYHNINVKIHDDLSGIASGTIKVTDSSHYPEHNQTINVTGGSKDYSKTINLDDGIFSVDVKTKDVATNENEETFQTYYVDNTKPVIVFNVNAGIFSTSTGAIRKASILGSGDSFYGDLTVTDNLSGAKSIEYEWSYNSSKPSSGYTTIYTSADTYSDRGSEVIDKEIEKPVGDHLYLHVKVSDVAGNSSYQCFGPYEDPIKLKDFEVTDIRDPRWTSVFWNDDLYKDYKNVTYKANQLPIDADSHPTVKNILPKKGYAFYFDVTSEYLYRELDRIEVTPSFYYIDSSNNRVPLDLYYNNNNNPLTLYGSSKDDFKLNLDTTNYGSVWIGGLSKLTLTKGVRIVKGQEWIDGWKDTIQYTNGKTQWWYGKYLIPSTAIFVRQGDSPRPENVINSDNIIVNFQLVAYKNGDETLSTSQIFTYVPNQWTSEGGPKSSKYEAGDVILYDNKYSALSDYKTYVIQ